MHGLNIANSRFVWIIVVTRTLTLCRKNRRGSKLESWNMPSRTASLDHLITSRAGSPPPVKSQLIVEDIINGKQENRRLSLLYGSI